MDLYAPAAVAGLNISVTGVANSLFSLIDAVAPNSSKQSGWDNLDGLDIMAEDGDVRITFSPNFTPTASVGRLLKSGNPSRFRKKDLENIKLISTSGTVKCSVDVGKSAPGETDSSGGGGGGAGGGGSFSGIYLSSDPSLINNQTQTPRVTNIGDLRTQEVKAPWYEKQDSTYGLAYTQQKLPNDAIPGEIVVVQKALTNIITVKAGSAGRLSHAAGWLDKTAPTGEYWVMIVDKNTTPVNGVVTPICAPQYLNHTNGVARPWQIDFRNDSYPFTNGCYIVLSLNSYPDLVLGGNYIYGSAKAA